MLPSLRSWASRPIAALALLVVACAPATSRRPVETPVRHERQKERTGADPVLQARAILLELADGRRYEPAALQAFLDAAPPLREALAVAVGRIGDPRGRGLLQGLALDPEPAVRRAAAFALGELGAAEAKSALVRAAVDDDAETGALAVEALGKIGAPLAEVRRALGALDAGEGDRRLAPFLFRFPGDDLVDAAAELLRSPEPAVRIGAAYALGRVAPPAGADILRTLVVDPAPRIRAVAARGLAEVGGPADLARLEPLLDDVDVSVRIQALRAGAKILGRSQAIAPLGWGTKLVAAVADPMPGVRAVAIESAAPWAGQPEVRSALFAAAANGEPRECELALLALARSPQGGGDDVEALAERFATSPDRNLRAGAAEAAARLGREDLLSRLAADREAAVRVAARGAELDAAADVDLAGVARETLADPDPAVRATALEALVERPVLPGDELARVLHSAAADRIDDARLGAIRALAARGGAATTSALEQGAIAAELTGLGEDRNILVRREAAAALVALGAPRPTVGPVATGLAGPAYALVLEQTSKPRYVALDTDRGRLVARLDCPEAPLTCLSFLKLAAQGYFDGTLFHRVVPDFVVQGGDPRGDGWGGPGYAIRDEINRLRYDRGALGMALSGPDTGGSQFFFTLSPQPHLDGGYTVFGHLVSGDALLDQLRQGDTLKKVEEVSWNE